ncbi:MAG: ribulose-phosphate 3-epimerase [Chloroflexi bacterium]|nr:ribulose-phosphate 3-epimerase [Chloroflexota bacterium]
MQNIISASILSANFSHLSQDILSCENADVDWIHIDVMDGHFVPNITMGPLIVETCKNISSLPLDCHLMVEKPETFLRDFSSAGASIITVHLEGNSNIHRTLETIKSLGCKSGIALNPGTPAEAISTLIPFVDLILLMTVNPGFSGQKFIPQMTNKIRTISKFCSEIDHPIIIEVDGGINGETIKFAQESGANAFVAASSIFNNLSGISSGVSALRRSLL